VHQKFFSQYFQEKIRCAHKHHGSKKAKSSKEDYKKEGYKKEEGYKATKIVSEKLPKREFFICFLFSFLCDTMSTYV
jgi:hypothetical protein